MRGLLWEVGGWTEEEARKKAAAAELELHQQSDALAAVEYAQRPAAVDNVAAAQVLSPNL
jgi:hypothetical protein